MKKSSELDEKNSKSGRNKSLNDETSEESNEETTGDSFKPMEIAE